MSDEIKPPACDSAGEHTGKSSGPTQTKRGDLRSIPGGSGSMPLSTPIPPGGPHKFTLGNAYGARGNRSSKRNDPVHEIDTIAKDVIAQLRFVIVTTGTGKERRRRRTQRPMDAPSANAIASFLRLRLDIYSQFQAARLLQETRAQVAELREQIRTLKQRVMG